jgi:two-component system, chemotaxis family, protein-glutamate methylesterase/glutaminase
MFISWDGFMTSSFYVAAIGASAGGLDPLKSFFSHLPERTGIAFVVITHLLRDYKSMLPEILENHTSMPVITMGQNLMLQPDHVFVMPEGVQAGIENGVFRLATRSRDEILNKTIDHFFHALAREQQGKAIGIIFSGMGSDGSAGVTEIHRCGGTVLVQDPATTKFSSMPMAAIAQHNPDEILPPKELAVRLLEIIADQERAARRSVDIR